MFTRTDLWNSPAGELYSVTICCYETPFRTGLEFVETSVKSRRDAHISKYRFSQHFLPKERNKNNQFLHQMVVWCLEILVIRSFAGYWLRFKNTNRRGKWNVPFTQETKELILATYNWLKWPPNEISCVRKYTFFSCESFIPNSLYKRHIGTQLLVTQCSTNKPTRALQNETGELPDRPPSSRLHHSFAHLTFPIASRHQIPSRSLYPCYY